MMELINEMVIACFIGVAISFTFLIIGSVYELIEFLFKGKFSTWVINLFK